MVYFKTELHSVDFCMSTNIEWGTIIFTLQQRWKNIGVHQIITPRRNVLADIFDHLTDNFDPLADNFDQLADNMSARKYLRGLIICCTPRFFHSCFTVQNVYGVKIIQFTQFDHSIFLKQGLKVMLTQQDSERNKINE